MSLGTVCLLSQGTHTPSVVRPDGKGDRIKTANRPFAAPTSPITYHGGPVLLGDVHIYYIWYGNWNGNTATTILTDLANNIGGSPYFGINTYYFQGSPPQFVNGVVRFMGSTTDNYSQGTTLTDASIAAIVSAAIANSSIPNDTNGVYFVLASADVNETSGFCTKYCGWHTFGTIAGANIKYAFVGNSDRCPTVCEEQTSISPNGNTGADGMASVIAHELEETTTDPNLNAWYDSSTPAQENADKCAWTFGVTKIAANQSIYNVVLGSRQYLIQQNWLAGGGCAMQVGFPPPPKDLTVTVH
jgi:hypothetical protein